MAAANAASASAARFFDKLVGEAPFKVTAVQVGAGSGFMAEFEAACGGRSIALALLLPKSPKQNGRVERMLAALRNEISKVGESKKPRRFICRERVQGVDILRPAAKRSRSLGALPRAGDPDPKVKKWRSRQQLRSD